MEKIKRIATGSDVHCSIELVEPVLFQEAYSGGSASGIQFGQPAVLRGKLMLCIARRAKIKTVELKFSGKARTQSPEGSGYQGHSQRDENDIMNHTWLFFDVHRTFKPDEDNGDTIRDGQWTAASGTDHPSVERQQSRLRQNLRLADSQSSKPDSFNSKIYISEQGGPKCTSNKEQLCLPETQQHPNGYRSFLPGIYGYYFELPIPNKCPETIKIGQECVSYKLEAFVACIGLFKVNVYASKPVIIVRIPPMDSVEQAGPVAINRIWNDELHYSLMISRRSFAIGSKISITLQLTPLSKIYYHGLDVLISESMQYSHLNDGKKIYRQGPTRNFKLLSRSCRDSGDCASSKPEVGTTSNQDFPLPAEFKPHESSGCGRSENLDDPEFKSNLPSELELQVPLPTCQAIRNSGTALQIHPDTDSKDIKVNHWIMVILKLSKLLYDGPSKFTKKSFELQIQSPIQILSCYATQAGTCLPPYSRFNDSVPVHVFKCGCPDALSQGDLQSIGLSSFVNSVIHSSLNTSDIRGGNIS